MQWYYAKNSMQLGPVTRDELLAKVATGEILPTDMVWRDGMSDWVPISSVAELGIARPVVSVPVGQAMPYRPPSQMSMNPAAMNIPNYLWQSIVVTIMCCLPFGIAAIVYAAKVDTLKLQGNIPAAMEASANAKKWCIFSLIGWVVAVGGYLLLVLLTVAGSAANS